MKNNNQKILNNELNLNFLFVELLLLIMTALHPTIYIVLRLFSLMLFTLFSILRITSRSFYYNSIKKKRLICTLFTILLSHKSTLFETIHKIIIHIRNSNIFFISRFNVFEYKIVCRIKGNIRV